MKGKKAFSLYGMRHGTFLEIKRSDNLTIFVGSGSGEQN